jgi:hypothetical protein
VRATILDIRVGAGESLQAGDQVWASFSRYNAFDEAGLRLESHPEA